MDTSAKLLLLAVIVISVAIASWIARRRRVHPPKSGAKVIGQEYAAAMRAEAHRVARGPTGPSPLPSRSYDDVAHGYSLYRVTETGLDHELREIVVQFATLEPSARDRQRGCIDVHGLYTLMQFAKRCGVFTLREKAIDRCREGFIALAMVEVERVDYRDVLWALAILDHAAESLGDRETPYEAGTMLASPAVAEMMRQLRARGPADRGLQAMRLCEVASPDGPAFVGWGSEPYRPRTDLLRMILAVSDALESGRYTAGDPMIATRLPAGWFRVTDDARLDAILDAASAASLSASPRAAPRMPALHVILAETATPADAEWLAGSARRPVGVGRPAFAVSEGCLVLVVIPVSPFRSAPSYETPESLRELASSFRPLLRWPVDVSREDEQ